MDPLASEGPVDDATLASNGLTSLAADDDTNLESIRALLIPTLKGPRKPCNCTKSQCLKLYCPCFANGEFCYLCDCQSCANNLDHEEQRQTVSTLMHNILNQYMSI